MPRIRDWIDLGKTTVSSLTSNDVTNLYSQEWLETRRMLTAEHGHHIESASGPIGDLPSTYAPDDSRSAWIGDARHIAIGNDYGYSTTVVEDMTPLVERLAQAIAEAKEKIGTRPPPE